jgi:hypothetical protein
MVSSFRPRRISATVGGLLTIVGTFGFCQPTPTRIVDCAPGYSVMLWLVCVPPSSRSSCLPLRRSMTCSTCSVADWPLSFLPSAAPRERKPSAAEVSARLFSALRSPARHCPNRLRANDDRGSTKSFAGRRVNGLPEPLVELLRAHQQEHNDKREAARQLWVEGG